jgi:uncharacterized protein YcgI (DUF1989 family)
VALFLLGWRGVRRGRPAFRTTINDGISWARTNQRETRMSDPIAIPARRGKAVLVRRAQTIKVINTHGQQVVDTWAFNRNDLTEFMSMEHSRATHHHMIPRIGDPLLTNRRRPILTLLEDTSGGIHDTLIAACDRYRYEELGCTEYHDNCTDNLAAALAVLGYATSETPAPLNLFMNIPWTSSGALSFEPPVSTPGSYVMLRAEMDLIAAFSACPQDILPINGVAGKPVEAHFMIGD